MLRYNSDIRLEGLTKRPQEKQAMSQSRFEQGTSQFEFIHSMMKYVGSIESSL
jgi:hypothetical protein